VVLFEVIAEHYRRAEVDLAKPAGPQPAENMAVLLVARVHRGTVESLQYARLLRPDHLFAMHMSMDGTDGSAVRNAWDSQNFGMPLMIQPSSHRDLKGSVFQYIEQIERRHPHAMVNMVVMVPLLAESARRLHRPQSVGTPSLVDTSSLE
jgi:hypothetical protein